MVGEDTEKALYDAASEGDVERFQQLVRHDPRLVERVSYPCSRNLLHVATLHGQANIAEELLKINPELARDVDSKNSSPLHIAAAKGHVEITKILVSAAPEMLWCRDGQGMNPVHVAAMNGCVEILEEMLQLDLGPAMERVHRGQTVLHLCVKHGRLEALRFLVKELGDLVPAKDDDGKTLMDCAVSCRQSQIADYLESIKTEYIKFERMVGDDTEKKLYDAATEGNVARFQQLVQDDPRLVERVLYPYSRNLLHIATLWGQLDIVKEVLRISPKLARNVDSQKSSPLHILAAEKYLGIPQQDIQSGLWICDGIDDMSPTQVEAAKRNFEIARELLSAAPEMLWCRDDQGMNPVHVAAMNGHVDILREMLQLDPGPAMQRLHRGQTVLHLCVKHRRFQALRFLVKELRDLIDAKDDDGETLLHWAARMAAANESAANARRITEYLVYSTNIEKQSTNLMGKTAKQIFEEGPISSRDDGYIRWMKDMLTIKYYEEPFFGFLSNPSMLELISKRREQTMVVMTLIATMAFTAAVSPPGGVWQEDTSSHRAGEAVIAYTHPNLYKHLVRANATAFVSSLVTIFLVAVQQRVEKGFLLLFSSYAVWVSLASIAVSYGGSVLVTARPNTDTQSLSQVIKVVVAVSLSFFGATLLLHPIKWLWSRIKTIPWVQRKLRDLEDVSEYWRWKWNNFRDWVTGSSNEQIL